LVLNLCQLLPPNNFQQKMSTFSIDSSKILKLLLTSLACCSLCKNFKTSPSQKNLKFHFPFKNFSLSINLKKLAWFFKRKYIEFSSLLWNLVYAPSPLTHQIWWSPKNVLENKILLTLFICFNFSIYKIFGYKYSPIPNN